MVGRFRSTAWPSFSYLVLPAPTPGVLSGEGENRSVKSGVPDCFEQISGEKVRQ